MVTPKDTAAVATYADHEVLTPQNKLRKALSDHLSNAVPAGPDQGRCRDGDLLSRGPP